jgi:hypothetical protein
MALWLHWCFFSLTLSLAKYFKKGLIAELNQFDKLSAPIFENSLANFNCLYLARLNSCTPS